MKKAYSRFKSAVCSKFAQVTGLTGVAVLGARAAHATALLDLTSAGTAITAELTPALAAAIPIAGTLLAAGIGWKFFKRFVK